MGDTVDSDIEPTMASILWAGPIAEARQKAQTLLGDGYLVTFLYKEERALLDALPVLDDQGASSYLVCKVSVSATAPTMVGILWDGSITEARQRVQTLFGDGYLVTYLHKDDRTLLDVLPILDEQGASSYLVCKTPIPATGPMMVGILWDGSITEARQRVQTLLGDGYLVTYLHKEDRGLLDDLPILDEQGTSSYLVCKTPVPATEPTMVGLIWAGPIAEARQKVQALLGDGYVVTFLYKEDRAPLDALPVLDDQGVWSYLVCKVPKMRDFL